MRVVAERFGLIQKVLADVLVRLLWRVFAGKRCRCGRKAVTGAMTAQTMLACSPVGGFAAVGNLFDDYGPTIGEGPPVRVSQRRSVAHES